MSARERGKGVYYKIENMREGEMRQVRKGERENMRQVRKGEREKKRRGK